MVIGQDHITVGKSHLTLYLPLHVLLSSIALKRPRSFNIQVNVTQYQGHINVNVKKNVFDVFSAIFCLILLSPANEVWGKVMFLHLCVILFTGRAGSAQPPFRQTPPGLGRPPWMQTHPPPDADPSRVGKTPLDADPPSVGQTPLEADPPSPGCRPLQGWADPPPPRYGQQAGDAHPTGMHTYL